MKNDKKSVTNLLDEILGPEYNNTQYIFRKIEDQTAFLNEVDYQTVVNVEVDPIDEFIWWLDISATCLKGYNQYNIGYSSVPCLKDMLAKYCRGTSSLYNYIKNNTKGKIALFEGLAYFNIFYFKGVVNGVNAVINGQRVYSNIFQHLENEKNSSVMQHEIYPYIEVVSSENIYFELLEESRYKKLYIKALNTSTDWWKLPIVYERLKLIHNSVIEIKCEDPELNKWKSLLLAYIPEAIKTKFEPSNEEGEDHASEENKSDYLTAFETILGFYYLTKLRGQALKNIVSTYSKISLSSLESPEKKLNKLNSNKMSDNEKRPFAKSLEKIKKLFENNSPNKKLADIILEINKDIDSMKTD